MSVTKRSNIWEKNLDHRTVLGDRFITAAHIHLSLFTFNLVKPFLITYLTDRVIRITTTTTNYLYHCTIIIVALLWTCMLEHYLPPTHILILLTSMLLALMIRWCIYFPLYIYVHLILLFGTCISFLFCVPVVLVICVWCDNKRNQRFVFVFWSIHCWALSSSDYQDEQYTKYKNYTKYRPSQELK